MTIKIQRIDLYDTKGAVQGLPLININSIIDVNLKTRINTSIAKSITSRLGGTDQCED